MTTEKLVETAIGGIVALKIIDTGFKMMEPKKRKGKRKQGGFL